MTDKKPPDKILKAIELKNRNPEMTLKEVGKIVGCTDVNICKAFKRYNIDWKKTQTFKQLEADILAGYKDKLLSQGITEEKINKAGLKDIAVSFGILADKEDQIRNKTAVKELLSDIVEKLAKNRRKPDINQDNIIDAEIIDNKANITNIEASQVTI